MGQPIRRDSNASLLCAEAFQRVAEPLLPKIASVKGTSPRSLSVPTGIGDLVVAAANLAFASELYIKTLLTELSIDVPRGHDLGKLYHEIPQAVRDEIEQAYAECRKDWYGRQAAVTIAKGAVREPEWGDYRSQSQDIGAVLSRSGDAFSSWRYIYEFSGPDQGGYQFHHFEYGLLHCACRALRAAIEARRPSG
jgi:hypothetical protein